MAVYQLFKVLKKKVLLPSDARETSGKETKVNASAKDAKNEYIVYKTIALRVESVLVHAISIWGSLAPVVGCEG